MNIFDIAVLAILGLCMFVGYRKGLILAVFQLISFFIAIFLTWTLYPLVSQALRQTWVYTRIKDAIVRAMNLSPQNPSDLIDSLPLPAMLRDALHTYNTPDIYSLLDVTSLEDYIGGYFAQIALNAIAVVLVFIIVQLLLQIITQALGIIGHLPLINLFNRAGGLAAGLIGGLFLIWLGFVLMNLLFMSPNHPEWFTELEASWLARWLYEHNWLTNMVTKI